MSKLVFPRFVALGGVCGGAPKLLGLANGAWLSPAECGGGPPALLDLACGTMPSLDLERLISKESNGPGETSTSSTEMCGLAGDEESGTGMSPGEWIERDLDRGLPSQTEDSDCSTSFQGSSRNESSGRDPL